VHFIGQGYDPILSKQTINKAATGVPILDRKLLITKYCWL